MRNFGIGVGLAALLAGAHAFPAAAQPAAHAEAPRAALARQVLMPLLPDDAVAFLTEGSIIGMHMAYDRMPAFAALERRAPGIRRVLLAEAETAARPIYRANCEAAVARAERRIAAEVPEQGLRQAAAFFATPTGAMLSRFQGQWMRQLTERAREQDRAEALAQGTADYEAFAASLAQTQRADIAAFANAGGMAVLRQIADIWREELQRYIAQPASPDELRGFVQRLEAVRDAYLAAHPPR